MSSSSVMELFFHLPHKTMQYLEWTGKQMTPYGELCLPPLERPGKGRVAKHFYNPQQAKCFNENYYLTNALHYTIIAL
ncbi:MAG TPA: hypothetical protein VEP90_12610 [Methylomirabilota bacterium]|nr:hypothetical protein [Methylomirabilota bacterium]